MRRTLRYTDLYMRRCVDQTPGPNQKQSAPSCLTAMRGMKHEPSYLQHNVTPFVFNKNLNFAVD